MAADYSGKDCRGTVNSSISIILSQGRISIHDSGWDLLSRYFPL